MLGLYRIFMGYVKAEASGEAPEKLINSFILNGISVWNINKNNEKITFCVSMSDYFLLPKLRRNLLCKIHIKIKKKYGIPILIKKAMRRKGIIIGIVMLVALNFFLSGYVWSINIIGTNSIDRADIIKACREQGITVGVRRKSVDAYSASQKLALHFDKIAWASFNVEGSVLNINISETETQRTQDMLQCNIVATCDGVIKSIKVREGTAKVLKGQAVRKGNLLVSGIVENQSTTKIVAADADIIAETYRSFSYEIPKTNVSYELSDEIKKRCVIHFFGLEVPLYLSPPKGEISVYYDEKAVEFFGKELPISYSTRYFSSKTQSNKAVDVECAKNMALNSVYDAIRTLPIENVKSFDVTVFECESYFDVRINCVFEENICEFIPLYTDD